MFGIVHRLGVKRTLDIRNISDLAECFWEEGTDDTDCSYVNCTCFTLIFGHALAVTKTYKAIVNISTKQASNTFQKLICKQNFIKLL